MPTDHISIVEAAYDLHVDDQTWLHHLASRISSVFPHAKGSIAHYYNPSALKTSIIDTILHASVVPQLFEHIVEGTRDADEDLIAAVYTNQKKPFCRPASQFYGFADGKTPPVAIAPHFAHPKFRQFGIKDMFGIFAELPDGSGCMLAALLEDVIQPAPRTIWIWNRIANHIAAGLHLRRVLKHRSDDNDSCPVLTTDRPIDELPSDFASVDATGTLAKQLRKRVLHIETARQQLHRSNTADALDLWTGLLDGRWSLVDHFTSHGTRKIIARRNEPQFLDPRALSPIERQVVNLVARGRDFKNIVRELGLRPNSRSVETHLSRALKKLKLKNRSELIQLVLPILQQMERIPSTTASPKNNTPKQGSSTSTPKTRDIHD